MKYYGIPIRNNRNCQFPIDLDYQIINELYNVQNYNISEIANYFNCGDETIRRFMIRNNIDRKEKTHKMAGWNKGLTKETDERVLKYSIKISNTVLNGREPAPKKYGSDWDFNRKLCLERDNYECQSCGNTNNLNVHHWTPYRFCYDNTLDNLVTLCHSCHTDIHKSYRNEGFIKEMEDEYYK